MHSGAVGLLLIYSVHIYVCAARNKTEKEELILSQCMLVVTVKLHIQPTNSLDKIEMVKPRCLYLSPPAEPGRKLVDCVNVTDYKRGTKFW